MKFFKLLFLVCVVSILSCEIDTESLEADLTTSTENQTRSSEAFIRRGKLKKKTTIGYRLTLSVENNNNSFTSFAILLEGSGGATECNAESTGEPNANGITKFISTINAEGVFQDGEAVRVTATPLNAEGLQAGEPQKLWITAQDNDGVDLVNATIKEMSNGNVRFKARFKGENINNIGEVEVTTRSLDGSTEPIRIGTRPTLNTGDTVDIIGLLRPGTDLTELAEQLVNLTVKDVNESSLVIDDTNVVIDPLPYLEEAGAEIKNPSIKRKNNGDYKFRVVVTGQDRDNVAYIEAIFSDYSGPEPIPTEFIVNFDKENGYQNIYKNNELSFDDPEAAIGETYTIILEMKDNEGSSLGAIETNVTVEE